MATRRISVLRSLVGSASLATRAAAPTEHAAAAAPTVGSPAPARALAMPVSLALLLDAARRLVPGPRGTPAAEA